MDNLEEIFHVGWGGGGGGGGCAGDVATSHWDIFIGHLDMAWYHMVQKLTNQERLHCEMFLILRHKGSQIALIYFYNECL